MTTRLAGWIGLSAALLLGAGCRVEHHSRNDSEDVNLTTPFGGIEAHTDEASVQQKVGLAPYPGATLDRKHGDGDNNNGAADVNLNFGSFHLGVKALSYRTGDAPDKVIAFYRKDMARYGAVLLCKDHHAVGTPTHTQDGLGCEEQSRQVHLDTDERQAELRAGSPQRQHLVTVDRDGSGSKFALVALDLPGHLGAGDRDDKSE